MIENWSSCLPDRGGGEDLYPLFKEKAGELSVTVLRAQSAPGVLELLCDQVRREAAQKVALAPTTLIDNPNLVERLAAIGLEPIQTLDRDAVAGADMGISGFPLAIAESATLVQDASSLHVRLVSMLPPVHLALVPTSAIVPSFATALEVLEKVYGVHMPPYLSFITGPSKTADIERVLTVGVHGPRRLIVLFVDPGALP